MNSNMAKSEKFDYLHLVYKFTAPLSANPTKCSNYSMGLALKGLTKQLKCCSMMTIETFFVIYAVI